MFGFVRGVRFRDRYGFFRLLPLFLELARQYRLPLREHSPVRYFSEFYGQWDGETHPEQISVDSLVEMLETEVREGLMELSCHPGYVDPDFESVYAIERETELRTLCDPLVKQKLAELGIQRIVMTAPPFDDGARGLFVDKVAILGVHV